MKKQANERAVLAYPKKTPRWAVVDRLWIVALHGGEVEYAEDKLGALDREILGEVPIVEVK